MQIGSETGFRFRVHTAINIECPFVHSQSCCAIEPVEATYSQLGFLQKSFDRMMGMMRISGRMIT